MSAYVPRVPSRRPLGVHAMEMLRWFQCNGTFKGSWESLGVAVSTTEIGAFNAALQLVEQKLIRVTHADGTIIVRLSQQGSYRTKP